jgi:hypothetical protein
VPLAPAQQRFVDAYILSPNAVQAYLAAYPGTPYRSAATLAGRLLKKVEVRAEIDAARRDRQRLFAFDELLGEVGPRKTPPLGYDDVFSTAAQRGLRSFGRRCRVAGLFSSGSGFIRTSVHPAWAYPDWGSARLL